MEAVEWIQGQLWQLGEHTNQNKKGKDSWGGSAVGEGLLAGLRLQVENLKKYKFLEKRRLTSS